MIDLKGGGGSIPRGLVHLTTAESQQLPEPCFSCQRQTVHLTIALFRASPGSAAKR